MLFVFAVLALVATIAAEKSEPAGYNPAAQLVLLPLKSAAYSAPPPLGFQTPFFPAESANFEAAVVEPVPATAAPKAVVPAPAPAHAAEEAESGQYYILSPEGRLQKVEYLTQHEPVPAVPAAPVAPYKALPKPAQVKGIVSSFQYKDVEPVSAPIYSYSSAPGPLVRVLRRAN